MNAPQRIDEPRVVPSHADGLARLTLAGAWTIETAARIERDLAKLGLAGEPEVELDLGRVTAFDTTGAWLVHRIAADHRAAGKRVTLAHLGADAQTLIGEIAAAVPRALPREARPPRLLALLDGLGRAAAGALGDALRFAAMLGAAAVTLGGAVLRPRRFRFNALVTQIDRAGFGAVPIIALISFLIGAIIAQQGFFFFRQWGADIYVVNMVGVLTVREIGVLLTAIMIAGRSGSAFTAEIGSMKMREEIDALRVIGLDPVEVLVLPRVLALMLAMPLLTFLADMASLTGAAVVSVSYGGMSLETYLERLRDALGVQNFLVGLIKAPVMAFVIALVACAEGFQVQGSAESLGRQTTVAVVKAIFLVIVVDALFALFFTAVNI